MSRFVPIGAALFAALAAWLSQGTIGFASPDGARIALLPLSLPAGLIAAVAAIAVVGFHRAGASMVPLALLGLIFLPWLPFGVPSAFLLWVKPLVFAVWIAVVVLMFTSAPAAAPGSPRAPRVAAALIAAVLFGASAWRVAPMIPGGDEPHYLVITQSLLLDGDLTIEDVHRRGDYRAYYAGDLPPHVQRRGRDGRIYSVHAPGLPVLVAPAFALGGHPGVVVLLILIAAAGSALAWHVGWLATRQSGAAWFGWAAVTLPVTAIFQSLTVYPDGPGGVLALTGLWALLRADDESRTGSTRATPWLWHGAALALLPWFHSRFAVIAGGFGALVLLRLSTTKNPAAKAVAFLSIPAVSAMLWVGYFIAIYGTPDPSAPYGAGEIGSFRFVPGGLGGLLFDQRFGLLAYAPVLAVPFASLALMVARRPWRRVALELLFVVVPYLLTVTHFAMWWGGWSPPARFFAPILPLLAVPAAIGWSGMQNRATRALAASALAATALSSAVLVGVDRGRLAFNTREAPALWLEWMGRLSDLTTAAPMWARDTDVPLFRAIAVWGLIGFAAWAGVRALDRRGRLRSRSALQTAVVAMVALVVMTASSVVWGFEAATGRATVSSQLQLLEAAAAQPRAVALRLDRWQRVPTGDVPRLLRIELSRSLASRPSGRDTSPLFALPSLPAGDYRLHLSSELPRGWVMVGIARDQFSLRTVPLPASAIELRFALPVRGLLVRGEEEARRTIRGLIVEPIRVFRPDERLTDEVARRAVRYGEATVFFLDDRSFPEPEAFWVAGGRTTTVALQTDSPRTVATLRLRNGPNENGVTLDAGTWRKDLKMPAGAEETVQVPLDPARGGVVVSIEASAGFRPSDQDPASRDNRFLGVWVKVE